MFMVPNARLMKLGSNVRRLKQTQSNVVSFRMMHQGKPVAGGNLASFISKNRNGLLAGAVAATLLGGYLARDSVKENTNMSVARRKTDLGVLETTFVPMDQGAVEGMLKQNEVTKTFKSSESKSVVSRFDCNNVDCNEPGEDRHVEDFLSKAVLSAPDVHETAHDVGWIQFTDDDNGSLKLFSIIDGHGGVAMADVLVERLHPSIIRCLRSAKAGIHFNTEDPLRTMRKHGTGVADFIAAYEPFQCSRSHGTESNKGESKDDKPLTFNADTISAALSCAYTDLDYDICTRPLRLLHDQSQSDVGQDSDFQKSSAQALTGACVSTVIVDEDRQEVHVANTGDSRVVAGYWVPPRTWPNGSRFLGGWRCEVLTGDHNAKDLAELERLKQDHPGEENLIDEGNGRLLGNLAPTRAFGDSPGYKWTDEEGQAIVDQMIDPPSWARQPLPLFDASKHVSLPYLTAKPGITMRTLESSDKPQGNLKFIIAASDGLWDFLSSEEAVGLVATHLEHPLHEPIPRETVKSGLIEESKKSKQMHPGPRPKGEERAGVWLYEDTNAATHLIRNAWNFSHQVDNVRDMGSLKAPLARWYKDDITCSVIFFDPPSPSADTTKPEEKGSPKGWFASLLQRWESSPIGMEASSIGWRYPLAHA